jgi:hypothetical protein
VVREGSGELIEMTNCCHWQQVQVVCDHNSKMINSRCSKGKMLISRQKQQQQGKIDVVA